MKKLTLFALFCLLSFGLMAAKMPVAQYKQTKVYKGSYEEYGPSKQIKVKQYHHYSNVGKHHVMAIRGEKHYAVNPDHIAMEWLNRNIKGNIYHTSANLYSKKTGEYLGLFQLHPGLYHLNFTNYKQVQELDGYRALKKVMGDRVQLVKPDGPGHWVGLRILPSKQAKAKRRSKTQK